VLWPYLVSLSPEGQTIGPQSVSDPRIICATNQAHNPVGFGYNNFTETGNISSYNMFSDALATRNFAPE
jgi:hypothetical protein